MLVPLLHEALRHMIGRWSSKLWAKHRQCDADDDSRGGSGTAAAVHHLRQQRRGGAILTMAER
jgi:hypothetical protein